MNHCLYHKLHVAASWETCSTTKNENKYCAFIRLSATITGVNNQADKNLKKKMNAQTN